MAAIGFSKMADDGRYANAIYEVWDLQSHVSEIMNGKSEPSLNIGREIGRQLNIDPAMFSLKTGKCIPFGGNLFWELYSCWH